MPCCFSGPPSSCLGSLAASAPSAWTLGSVRHRPAPFESYLIWEGISSHQLPPHPNHQRPWPFPFRVCRGMYTCLITLSHVIFTGHLSYSFSLGYIFYLVSFNCCIVDVQYYVSFRCATQWFATFMGHIPLTGIVKCWLYSLCYTVYSCSLFILCFALQILKEGNILLIFVPFSN